MPDQHSHVMGGSSAARRVHCPGSLNAEAEIPTKDEPNEFADRGSMLHAAMELLIVNDPDTVDDARPIISEMVGQDFGFEGHDMTEELAETKIVPAYQSWVNIRDKHKFDDWFIEQRVSLSPIAGAFGTTDLLAFGDLDNNPAMHVIDWKFGDGVEVSPVESFALAFYGAAALYDNDDEELLEVTELFYEKPEMPVYFHIIQPRVGFDQVHFEWPTNVQYLEDFVDLATAAAQQAHTPNPPLKVGDWCRWCAAKPKCPAFTGMATEALSKPVSSMSATDLAKALQQATLLKPWIADVFKLAQEEMERGAAVPGFKLVHKQARRSWVDEKVAEAEMRKSKKVKVADMHTKKLITPTQFEKLNPKLYGVMEEKHVQKKSSGLTVVDDKDPREAVTSSAALLADAMQKAGHA
jgi:hypothetical protein